MNRQQIRSAHGNPPARGSGTPIWTRRRFLQVAGVGLGSVILPGCGPEDASPPAVSPSPDAADLRPGGDLRVAVGGGTTADSLDPHFAFYNPGETARILNLHAQLVELDFSGLPQLALLEELEPNEDYSTWTARLLPDIQFHDGRTMTAEDVLFSVRRAADPLSSVYPAWQFLNIEDARVIDDLTVELPLQRPVAALPHIIGDASPVVASDYDPEDTPIGAGPFQFESYTPGDRSVFTRFDDYYRNRAYPDSLAIIDILDETARVNALLSGQADIVASVPPAQVPSLDGSDSFEALITEGSVAIYFAMRVDEPPFDDVRVRQALKLLVDRDRIVAQALSGRGSPGNDVYAQNEPCGAELQLERTQDVERAQELLSEAGYDNLDIELVVSHRFANVVDAGNVLAESAREAGFDISVREVEPAAFSEQYTEWPFSGLVWAYANASFLTVTLNAHVGGAYFNDSRYSNEEFERLLDLALAEGDDSMRCDLINQMRSIYFEDGGWIIPVLADNIDGYAANLVGLSPHPGYFLGGYRFAEVAFT